MANNFFPNGDSPFLAYATNFANRVSAAPDPLGLDPSDAAALAELLTDYANALATAVTPSTRTRAAIGWKNVCKNKLIAEIRVLAKRIQANPAVSVPQRQDLGLPIHQTVPSPIPAPTSETLLNIVGIGNRTFTLRLADENTPNKRAKPPGVAGADIFCYVAPAGSTAAPRSMPTGTAGGDELGGWTYLGQARRSTFVATFDPAQVGRTVHFVARWFNPRGEPGPVGLPVTGVISGAAAGPGAAAANPDATEFPKSRAA